MITEAAEVAITFYASYTFANLACFFLQVLTTGSQRYDTVAKLIEYLENWVQEGYVDTSVWKRFQNCVSADVLPSFSKRSRLHELSKSSEHFTSPCDAAENIDLIGKYTLMAKERLIIQPHFGKSNCNQPASDTGYFMFV